MALYSGDNAIVLQKGLNTQFAKWRDSYKNLSAKVKPIFSNLTTDQEYENLGFFGQNPRMRLFEGSRVINSFKDYQFIARVSPWESTIEVDVDLYNDDKYGLISAKLKTMTDSVELNDLRQTVNLINLGSTLGVSYDGQSFFSTTHNESGSNQTNIVPGSGTSLAQITDDFGKAMELLLGLVGDQGEPINAGVEGEWYVYCGPALYWKFRQLQNLQLINNTSNIMVQEKFQVVVLPLLTGNSWYLFDGSGEFKPFIKITRQAPEFTSLDKPDSESVFHRRKAYYGVFYRMGFTYGKWQKAVKITNS